MFALITQPKFQSTNTTNVKTFCSYKFCQVKKTLAYCAADLNYDRKKLYNTDVTKNVSYRYSLKLLSWVEAMWQFFFLHLDNSNQFYKTLFVVKNKLNSLTIESISSIVQPLWKRQRAEAGLLNKSSRLAPTLGVTKFIIDIDMILVTLCCAT